MQAQVPGDAINLNGQSQYVNFGEVLKDVRTVSFWIKLETNIDSTNNIEVPILVRDPNVPSQLGTGEFAIYFGKVNTPEAGRLVFLRATVSQAFSIKSDKNQWFKNRWYHVAAVIHPSSGMKLYINGVLQQETNTSTAPIYIRSEGNTGDLFLGKWGNITGFGISASFDELRFHLSAQGQAQIRDEMCHALAAPYSGLKAYYNFDNATAFLVPALVGNANGQATGLTTQSYAKSNVPVGDESTHTYSINPSTLISISEQVTLRVDSVQTPSTGIHLYVTQSPLLSSTGSHPYFYGVWFTDTVASYNAALDFGALSSNCDSCNELRSRDHQRQSNWNLRNTVAQNCVFDLPQESPGQQTWREEYWVKPALILNSGLVDTLSQCEGDPILLSPTNYPGATYLWEDGSTSRNRQVDSTGLYSVTIKWRGCTINGSVYVKREYMPYFTLPNDTAICAGDTLKLIAPLNIDSAIYIWAGGMQFGRTFDVYFPGTIPLSITVGNCTWTDEINIDVIRNFQLNLGPDTTVCLGQEYVLEAPDGVNILWNDGSTERRKRFFNTSQTVWVKAWNDCFEKVDTVTVTYEECDCHFFVANSFTPNNDGTNDVFLPVTGCYFESFEMQIFDRWGNLVYHSRSLEEGWDGTRQGKALPQGVYTYQLRYKKYTWQVESDFERGRVNLIR